MNIKSNKTDIVELLKQESQQIKNEVINEIKNNEITKKILIETRNNEKYVAKHINNIETENAKLKKEIEQVKKTCSELVEKNDLNNLRMTSKNFIQNLDYHLVDHCNLNCKCCSTYSPLSGEKYASLSEFEKDLTRLHEIIGDKVIRLHLLGGEPLLHPEIEGFARISRRIFKKTRIDFTTNGLLIKKMPESFWDTLRETNIDIKYTRYPINLDYDDMENYIKEKGVKVFSAGGEIKYFRKIPLKIAGTQDIYRSYLNCPYADCTQIRSGKLYRCSVAGFSDLLNNSLEDGNNKFILTEYDYVDLYGEVTEKELFEFLSNAFPFCQYCDTTHMDSRVEWGKSSGEVSEWLDK